MSCDLYRQEPNSETGLDYFGARYFSSAQGRWTSPDWSAAPQAVPCADLTDPQTLNLYSYVRNNPLAKADTDGHCLWDLCIGEGAALYAAGAATVTAAVYLSTPEGQQSVRVFVTGVVAGVNGLVGTLSQKINEANSPPPPAQFSPKVKEKTAENAGGKCEYCGVDTVKPEKSKKGVTPPPNEQQTDHYEPKATGGTDDPDTADVGPGLVDPDDLFAHRLRLAAHLLPIGYGESELGEHFFMRDRFVVLAPFVGLGDRPGFCRAEGVAVLVEEHFEEIAHGAEFGRRQEIDESVSLLPFLL
jgi:RHS repeat-associated protein